MFGTLPGCCWKCRGVRRLAKVRWMSIQSSPPVVQPSKVSIHINLRCWGSKINPHVLSHVARKREHMLPSFTTSLSTARRAETLRLNFKRGLQPDTLHMVLLHYYQPLASGRDKSSHVPSGHTLLKYLWYSVHHVLKGMGHVAMSLASSVITLQPHGCKM